MSVKASATSSSAFSLKESSSRSRDTLIVQRKNSYSIASPTEAGTTRKKARHLDSDGSTDVETH